MRVLEATEQATYSESCNHTDKLGSTRALSKDGGTVTATYDYDAYGNLTSQTGFLQPFQFAGQYTDAESGLQYLRARYYDSTTQQFLSRDPLVMMTWAPYSYTKDSPVDITDPSGMKDKNQQPPPCPSWLQLGLPFCQPQAQPNLNPSFFNDEDRGEVVYVPGVGLVLQSSKTGKGRKSGQDGGSKRQQLGVLAAWAAASICAGLAFKEFFDPSRGRGDNPADQGNRNTLPGPQGGSPSPSASPPPSPSPSGSPCPVPRVCRS